MRSNAELKLPAGVDRQPEAPATPKNIEETGLDISFVVDLVLKQVLFMGDFILADIARTTGLPVSIMDEAIEILRRERLVEVKGTAQYLKTTYRFGITASGRIRAGELMGICRYTGPAPVTLEDYRRQTEAQTIRRIDVDEARMRQAFAGLVIDDALLGRLGTAVVSGKPIFLYGPSGNGKTTIAEGIGDLLSDIIFVPYAILVGGQIITVFDPVNHQIAAAAQEAADPRWVAVRRPVIKVGGEFTLRMLELEFNPIANFYEAPLQMKANHGLFIIDDFGRQPVDPQAMLNRWIISFDREVDFLSLHTGLKFEIPFDQLVIFATNLEPHSILDEAFLRRIRYKICIGRPSEQEFERIFQQVCQAKGVSFDTAVYACLLENYRRFGIAPDACHASDLIGQIIDRSAYRREPVRLTREAIEAAWQSYFLTS